jgi:hypothetical protein
MLDSKEITRNPAENFVYRVEWRKLLILLEFFRLFFLGLYSIIVLYEYEFTGF